MGLDSVELLVDIEKEFEIEISNLEAEKISTVGDFSEIIIEKLRLTDNKKNDSFEICKSKEIFYKIRRIIAENQKYPIKSIALDTRLITIFKEKNRRQDWNIISEKIGLDFPKLKRPKPIENTIHLIGSGLVFLILFLALNSENYLYLLLWLFIPVFWIFSYKITLPIATRFGPEDMRELVEGILSLNYKKLKLSKSNEQEILWILKGIINEKMGIPIDEIKYNSSLSNDLGIE